MRSSQVIAFSAAIASAFCLGGCSTLDRIIGADDWKDWSPTSTSIQVHADGSLTETIFDKLDQTWYQGNELQDMIARSMNEYNSAGNENAVTVTSYSDAGGEVKVVIDYRSGEDFARYNDVQFCSGSMLDAQMEGFLFKGPFYAVDGRNLSGEAIDAAEPISHKEYSVVISDGSHDVQVPGEIRYVSGGVEILNSHAARAVEGAAADPEDPSVYIIYEKDQEAPGEQEIK